MSRLGVVTWTRHVLPSPLYCLFGADGDVLHLGEELSPHDSAISFDWRWNLGKTQIHAMRELGKT